MTELRPESVRNAENAVRDTINWLAVFKTESEVPDEAVQKIREQLDSVGTKIGDIKCDESGVDASSCQAAADALAAAKQWWGVFSADMGDEAKKVMHEQLDGIGTALAAIETK